MGMRFKNENWGLINFLFFFTVHALGAKSAVVDVASCAFLAGGILMPICCGIMAFWKSAKPALLFAPAVSSLLAGGALTLYIIFKA